ncbi:MAG: hypothetical protein SVC26_09675 [Pseudomonadota bacterium]|nr:hypothetical protein [Pseudomonadota bacterium]
MDKEEVFKLAVSTRQFEIQMFWQRSNYFMILNTAIAVGFFSLKNESYAPVLAALGAAVSMLWYFVSLGGKYWQSRWEEAASRLESECAPEAKLFAATKDEVHQEVEASLVKGRHRGFQKWLDGQILKKPSVSYQMTFLSFFFVIFWGLVLVVFILMGPSQAQQEAPADPPVATLPSDG